MFASTKLFVFCLQNYSFLVNYEKLLPIFSSILPLQILYFSSTLSLPIHHLNRTSHLPSCNLAPSKPMPHPYLALTKKPPLFEILQRIYHKSGTFLRLCSKQTCKFSREFSSHKASDIPEVGSSDGVWTPVSYDPVSI